MVIEIKSPNSIPDGSVGPQPQEIPVNPTINDIEEFMSRNPVSIITGKYSKKIEASEHDLKQTMMAIEAARAAEQAIFAPGFDKSSFTYREFRERERYTGIYTILNLFSRSSPLIVADYVSQEKRGSRMEITRTQMVQIGYSENLDGIETNHWDLRLGIDPDTIDDNLQDYGVKIMGNYINPAYFRRTGDIEPQNENELVKLMRSAIADPGSIEDSKKPIIKSGIWIPVEKLGSLPGNSERQIRLQNSLRHIQAVA